MDLVPAAFFLIPGAFAVTAHRFASSQAMSTGSQVAWAAIYSTLTYFFLQTPAGAWLISGNFPSSLFGQNAQLIATPEVSVRFIVISLGAAAAGLAGGRTVATQRAHRLVAALTGRNLHSTVWIELFRNAPRQWVRVTRQDLDLIGWLESASDGPLERSLILSHVYRQHDGRREPVPADLMLVDASRFDTVILLGQDVAASYQEATQRAGKSPMPQST